MPELRREKSFGYNARRAHRAFDRILNHYLSAYDLKTGYWYYLRLLWVEDGLSQRELSKLNNVAENTTTLIIAAMIDDGLVYRERDDADRRRWRVFLTEKAQALKGDLAPFANKVNAIGARGIEKKDLDNWLRVTAAMSENLEAAFRDIQES